MQDVFLVGLCFVQHNSWKEIRGNPKYFIAASLSSALSPNTNLYFVSSNAATSLIADLIPSRSVAFLKLVKAITFGARNSNTRRRMFLFSGVLSSSATRGDF